MVRALSEEPVPRENRFSDVANDFCAPYINRLIGFQWGLTLARRSQLGFPAYGRARIR